MARVSDASKEHEGVAALRWLRSYLGMKADSDHGACACDDCIAYDQVITAWDSLNAERAAHADMRAQRDALLRDLDANNEGHNILLSAHAATKARLAEAERLLERAEHDAYDIYRNSGMETKEHDMAARIFRPIRAFLARKERGA